MDFLLALRDPHASGDFGDVESLDIIQAEDVPVLRRQRSNKLLTDSVLLRTPMDGRGPMTGQFTLTAIGRSHD
jgi:hypothetical protein